MHSVTLTIPDDAIYTQIMQFVQRFRQVEVGETIMNHTDKSLASLEQILGRCQQTNVFNKIDNPVVWQQQLRDEWE